jgi:hypothetical protein
MRKCSACGEKFPNERTRFCPSCGTPSKSSKVSSGENKASTQKRKDFSALLRIVSSNFTPSNLSTQLRRIPLGIRIGVPITIVTAFIGTFIALSIPGFLSPLTAAQMPSYSEAFSDDEKKSNVDSLCSELNSFLPDEATLVEFDGRISTLAAIGNEDNGRKMTSLYAESWFQYTNEEQAFVDNVNQAIDSTLNNIVSSFEQMGVDESNRPTLQEVWQQEFTTDAKDRCDFTISEENAIQKLSSYDSAIAKGISIADAAPWYPDGFSEWNSEMAYRSAKGRLDCYRCKGLVYEFIPRYGCSSLYVEANHVDSQSRVYDWSNDTANNLKAGQSVFLEFYSYSYPPGTTRTQITEVNCR